MRCRAVPELHGPNVIAVRLHKLVALVPGGDEDVIKPLVEAVPEDQAGIATSCHGHLMIWPSVHDMVAALQIYAANYRCGSCWQRSLMSAAQGTRSR